MCDARIWADGNIPDMQLFVNNNISKVFSGLVFYHFANL